MTIDNREMNRRLIKLSESSTGRFWRIDYDKLSTPEQVFLLIWELESEVNNDGFHQYFHNSSGALVVSALKTVGAEAIADIAQRALNAVGNAKGGHRPRAKNLTAHKADMPVTLGDVCFFGGKADIARTGCNLCF
jgi:Domain of unknown function (DUF4375)